MPCCYCSAIVNNSVSAWKITKPVFCILKPEVSDLYSYKAPYIAQSMKPSCASTDTPTFRVIKSSATGASSKWHACMVFSYSRLWICYMTKSNNRAFLAALDRRTRPLIVSNCLAKLGAVELLLLPYRKLYVSVSQV